MGVASINRTTSGMVITGGVAAFKSSLTTLIAAMAPGLAVRAADLNTLNGLIAKWDAHYHTVTDEKGINTFGNLATYSTTGDFVTATSGVVKGSTPPTLNVSVGQTIDHTNHNALRSAIEYFRAGHTHTITDTTS